MRAETLEKAAQLLMLRRDTLWIIDGAGPVHTSLAILSAVFKALDLV